ncbi:hypothetical protein OIO90_006150 [Microbotryomycetes sp. JL221]|nr:hypothetical protein OIO90_006150 [Microbotryomycetes sp. JL221]
MQGRLRFAPKRSHRIKTPISSGHQATCGILLNDIAAAPGKSTADKRAMLDMLNRFEQDNLAADEQGSDSSLADKLEGLDLGSLSPQELLQLLGPDEQQAFHAAISDKSQLAKLLDSELELDNPWWMDDGKNDDYLLDGLNTCDNPSANVERDSKEKSHLSGWQNRPALLDDSVIPTLGRTDAERDVNLAELVYNLTALVMAYSFTIRSFGAQSLFASLGEPQDLLEAVNLLQQSMPILFEKSTLRIASTDEAIEYVASHAPPDTLVGPSLSTVLEDTSNLLKPAVVVEMAPQHLDQPAVAHLQLRDSGLFKTQGGYINGEWTSGSATERFKIMNPGTGEELGTLPDMTVQDVKQAVEHAQTAFTSWKHTSEYARADLLNKLFKLMKENAEDLAQIITAENGKSLTDARGEVTYGSSFIEWFAGEAVRSYGDIIPPSVPGLENRVYKQPVGVCGIITPWNFPNAMVTRKVGAALAAGCTVVMKAPAETPYSVLAIVELAERAGFPRGVINCVTTNKHVADVGREVCQNPSIKKVSFTGSTRVGKILTSQSANTLKKLSMELGGNAPFIVFDDADLDKAVAGAILCKFRLSGQTCVCANRIFVQDGIYDAFAAKLVEAVKQFKVGPGHQEGVTHGPLIHSNAVDKVQQHVEDAKSKGASVLLGGSRMDLPGHFFQPTVLGDAQRCAIDEDETFGPVAALYRFKTEEEVIARANEPDVGLAGYFFTENIARLHRVAAELQVGMVGANTGAISQACVPFGGVGESGSGREANMGSRSTRTSNLSV